MQNLHFNVANYSEHLAGLPEEVVTKRLLYIINNEALLIIIVPITFRIDIQMCSQMHTWKVALGPADND